MSTLRNDPELHALAKFLAGTSEDRDTCVNIEGPPKGSYTSYRVTEHGRQAVLDAAKQVSEQGVLF